MNKLKKESNKAPEALGPYSQSIVSQPFVFLSGQIPLNAETGNMPEGIVEQTKQVFENIKAVLSASDLTLDNIVKTTVFLQDLNDFNAMNEVYKTYFSEPYPARSAVQVAKLPKGALIEIESIATTN